MWPFRRKPDPILTDAAALDVLLENDETRASVLTFIIRSELECLDSSPEALIELAIREGLDRETAQLLCALAGRLEGAQ